MALGICGWIEKDYICKIISSGMALGNKNASFIQWFIGVGDMVVINLLFFIVCHVLGEKYTSVMEDYGKSVASFMDEDLKKKIDDKGFSNDPDFVTLLAKVGKEIGSATFRKPEMPPAKKSYADQMVENILRKNANT